MNRIVGWVVLAAGIAVGCDAITSSGHRVRVADRLEDAGADYPAVVGEINGQQISGSELGAREYFVRRNEPGIGATEVRRVAINAIIADRVLLQSAAEQGLTVDAQEVLAELDQMRQLAAEDDGLRAAFQSTAVQLGITEDEVFRDPRVLAQYQRAFTLGRMRTRIIETLPVGERMDAVQVARAVDRFVAAHRPRVRMFVDEG